MIERLRAALRILASDAATQIAAHREWTCTPGRLAPELDDALLLVRSCQQESLSASQQDALDAVETMLAPLSEAAEAGFWSESSLARDPRWRVLRECAGRALAELEGTA
jgi:hypothetical protein